MESKPKEFIPEPEPHETVRHEQAKRLCEVTKEESFENKDIEKLRKFGGY